MKKNTPSTPDLRYYGSLDEDFGQGLEKRIFASAAAAELDRIVSLDPFEVGGLSHDYVTSDASGLGQAIAAAHAVAPGIIVANRSWDVEPDACSVDTFGRTFDVAATLPSAFDVIRERFPKEVGEICDLPVLYPNDRFANVVFIDTTGHAEYGAILLLDLPSVEVKTSAWNAVPSKSWVLG